MIKAEAAAQVCGEFGGVLVGRCAGDDYGGTAGGIIFYSVLNAIGKGVFGKLVEQRVDFLHAVAVAALGGYLRQRTDKKLVFLAPTDDAGEMGG